MLTELAAALERGMGLKVEHQRLLIRVGWVAFVSGHVLWVCGFLTTFGLASPFARAGDVEKLLRASEVTARLQMQNEIRLQVRNYCQSTDQDIKALALKRIDELRVELFEIAKIRVPEVSCTRGGEPTA